MTMNAGSIRQEYPDVMKQSRFFQKLSVQLQFRMTVGYPKRLVPLGSASLLVSRGGPVGGGSVAPSCVSASSRVSPISPAGGSG